jgi:hypothetical protein
MVQPLRIFACVALNRSYSSTGQGVQRQSHSLAKRENGVDYLPPSAARDNPWIGYHVTAVEGEHFERQRADGVLAPFTRAVSFKQLEVRTHRMR